MTANYNVHQLTSKKYFFDSIKEQFPEILKNNSLRNELTAAHNKFYAFLKKELFELFFNINIDVFLSQEHEKNTQFRYAKKKIVEKTVKIGNEQLRYNLNVFSDSEDTRKTKQAFAANFIHSSDAKLVHNLIIKTNCFTIHDAFITDVFKIHEVMDELNNFFDDKLGGLKTDYAFFIAL